MSNSTKIVSTNARHCKFDWTAMRPQITEWVNQGFSEVMIGASLGVSAVAVRPHLKKWGLRTLAGQQRDAREKARFHYWLAEIAQQGAKSE